MYAAVALTLIVAGCSLAVAVGGGLVDRKRPFTLLRVSGTQVGVLSRVVLLEAAVPLLAATVVAAGIAYGTSVLAFVRLAPAGHRDPAARPGLLHDHGHRARGRLRGHHADAAAAPHDDGTLGNPLRIASAAAKMTNLSSRLRRPAGAAAYAAGYA